MVARRSVVPVAVARRGAQDGFDASLQASVQALLTRSMAVRAQSVLLAEQSVVLSQHAANLRARSDALCAAPYIDLEREDAQRLGK